MEEQLRDGLSVRDISILWNVSPSNIYYWINKTGLDLKQIKADIKKGIIVKRKPKFTYHFYVTSAYKRGAITLKQKRQFANKFYQNKGNKYLGSNTLEEL